MEVKLTKNRLDINPNAKETYLVTGTDLEGFRVHLENEFKKTNSAFYFKSDAELTHAFFEDTGLLFIYEHDKPNSSEEKSKQVYGETDTTKVNKSSVFTRLSLVLLLILSSIMPNTATAATYFGGSISEDPTQYVGLQNAKFATPTGAVVVPGFLSIIKDEKYTTPGYTYVDPNRIKNLPSAKLSPLPDKASADLLLSILAYPEKYSLQEIKESTGISVNDRQLKEAVQLALWVNSASVQINYQIDVNSINDAAVRALATEIATWASHQVSSKPEGIKMHQFLFPNYSPSLNTKDAELIKTDTTNKFGPYIVQSQQKAVYNYAVLGGKLVDAAGMEIKVVQSGVPFYVVFPTSYNGDKTVRLVGIERNYELNYGQGRLWIAKNTVESDLSFMVGTSTGHNGVIRVIAKDSITGKAVPNVVAEISTTSPLKSITTDDKGEAMYQTPAGRYTVRFIVPDGYITPQERQVDITFAGDIQEIKLDLAWSNAIVDFFTVDSQTLMPAGDSEAFIYDSEGKAIKRVGIKGGKVQGIVIPEGEYTFVQYKSQAGYGINIGTPFKAEAGKVTKVTISQDPNVLPTVMTIEGASTQDSYIYTISSGTKILFKLTSNNILSLNLPPGDYNVVAHKSDGTVKTPPTSFKSVLNGRTDVTLKREMGTETVTFNFVDTVKKQPIPNLVVGLFDENHNLITYKTANANGKVTFENVVKYNVHFVNILAAPPEVSGFSAVGNRFLGQTKEYNIELYSLEYIKAKTEEDTIYRVPNVTYTGASYTYPK